MTSGAGADEGAPSRLVYLYGFVEAGEAGVATALAGLKGLDPSAEVRAVAAGDVAALVSDVPAEEYDEDALAQKLNDLASLEALARGHERVLDGLVERTSVLPTRLGTLYRSDEDVRRLVAERERALVRAFQRLGGGREWGVKVVVRRPRLVERLEGEMPDPSAAGAVPSRGAAYLAERRRERELEERVRREMLERAREVHAALERVATRSALVRSHANLPRSDDGELALNAAYLVSRTQEVEFRDTVADLDRRLEERGFSVLASGPWPPYNFADEAIA